MAFIGESPRQVKIRFTGKSVHFIREKQWHSSQQLDENPDGSITLTMSVAEPLDVIRWARQFGDDATVIEN